jgi:hypothetical protein
MKDAHRALCGALDRLLTIGSYYQPSHDRFQSVARGCEEALRRCLGGRARLEILVDSRGLIIDEGVLAPGEVEARRLFDLLDPLHVALVEIDAAAGSDHLHLALAAFKTARNSLTASQGYREIEIKGLPETVRALSRSLFLKTRDLNRPARPPRETQPRDDEVTFFDHNLVSEFLLTGTEVGQDCEKKFLGIIQGIMATTDPARIKLDAGQDQKPDDWLPTETLQAIGGVLDALAGTGSDLMNLQHLISQAQTALDTTGDPQLVELVFSRLQKDAGQLARKRVQPKMIGRQERGNRADSRRKVMMSLEQMRQIIDELPVPCGPMADPREQAAGDCLAICVQTLELAPTEELQGGIENTLLRLLTTRTLSQPKRATITRALQALIQTRPAREIAPAWQLIWDPLRRNHPEALEGIWLGIWPGLSSGDRLKAWPFLVNDLLLGMPTGDRLKRLLLLESLSRVEALGKHEARVVLENLPALQQVTICPEFFDVPPPLLYPVHKVLVGCSFSAFFGPQLHEALRRQAPHRLSEVLLEVMDEFDPVNRAVYHAILDQGIQESLTPDMSQIAPQIIQEVLADLHWDFMDEDWVPEAIRWLGRLGGPAALPVVMEVLREKKYMILQGWPRPAREAALDAQAELRERLAYTGAGETDSELGAQPEDPVPAGGGPSPAGDQGE